MAAAMSPSKLVVRLHLSLSMIELVMPDCLCFSLNVTFKRMRIESDDEPEFFYFFFSVSTCIGLSRAYLS